MATLDETLEQLIQQGIPPQAIAARATAMATEAPKQYFLNFLLDPNLSPTEYAITAEVSNWAAISAFFAAPPTDQYNLQRAYQSILIDIAEAIQTHDAERFLLALMLGAKAVKP